MLFNGRINSGRFCFIASTALFQAIKSFFHKPLIFFLYPKQLLSYMNELSMFYLYFSCVHKHR
jgi:hypothetical protein